MVAYKANRTAGAACWRERGQSACRTLCFVFQRHVCFSHERHFFSALADKANWRLKFCCVLMIMVYVPSNTTKGRISMGLSLQSKGLSIWNSNASCSFMFPIKKPHILHVIPPCLESLSARGLRFDNALRRRRRSLAPAAANPARKRSRTPQSLGSCWDGWDGGWFSGDPWGDPWLSHWQPIDMWVSKSLLTHL